MKGEIMNINTIKKIMENSIDTRNPEQSDILTCVAIIDECLEEITRLQKVVNISKEFISISKKCQTCPCDSEYMMTSCEVCPYNSEIKFDELEQMLIELEG